MTLPIAVVSVRLISTAAAIVLISTIATFHFTIRARLNWTQTATTLFEIAVGLAGIGSFILSLADHYGRI